MKTILLTFFIFLTTFSFGQDPYVFSIGQDYYRITFSEEENNKYKFCLLKDDNIYDSILSENKKKYVDDTSKIKKDYDDDTSKIKKNYDSDTSKYKKNFYSILSKNKKDFYSILSKNYNFCDHILLNNKYNCNSCLSDYNKNYYDKLTKNKKDYDSILEKKQKDYDSILEKKQKDYYYKLTKNEKDYNFILSKNKNDYTVNFTLPKLDREIFKNVFYKKLIILDKTLDNNTLTTKPEIDQIIEEIFDFVVKNIYTIDDLDYGPSTGRLKIAKEVYLYRDTINSLTSKLNGIKFEIDKVQIVFQQGFIQDIIVDGKIIEHPQIITKDSNFKLEDFKDAELRFTNYYGIGFSSKKNIRKLNKIKLYLNQKNKIDKSFIYSKKFADENGIDSPTINKLFKKNKISLRLGEVIESYDFNNDLYSTDYSPANIKVTIEGDKSTTLYKDKTFKILEARVFSDLFGFDRNKPNGLIQIELEKQFNFNTNRSRTRIGVGYLEYIKLIGGLTKLDDNNRSLIPIRENKNDTIHRYTTPINVLNHQTSNIGLNVNIALFDIPSFKSQVHFNGGFRFAQTKVLLDSIRTFNKEYNLDYWQFFPELIWHIKPEKRFGFYATYRPKYFHSLTDGIEFNGLVNKPKTGSLRKDISNWVNEFELMGYLYFNEEKQNSKFFIRWRLNSEMGYSQNNFSQFQVGYSFYFLGNVKQ